MTKRSVWVRGQTREGFFDTVTEIPSDASIGSSHWNHSINDEAELDPGESVQQDESQ